MVRKNILGVAFFSVFALASSAYAGKVELTTYYPSPSGEYGKLQAKGSCVGTDCQTDDATPGTLKVKTAADGSGGDLTVDNKATITTADITTANVSGTTTSNTLVATTATNTNLTVTGALKLPSAAATVAHADGEIWIQS